MKEKQIKEFTKELRELLVQMTEEGTRVEIHETVKNNDVTYPSITLIKKETYGAPSIRLDGLYHDYLEGRSMEEIAEIVLAMAEPIPESGFDTEAFMDFDSAKENILFRVVGLAQNTRRLAEMPHVRFLDLAITFYYMLERKGGSNMAASIQIQNDHLELWQVDTGTLYDIAIKNTVRKMPVRMRAVFDVLTEAVQKEEPKVEQERRGSMYVLSNEKNFYGAAAIYYPGVLKEAAERLEADLYVLPSSVHEVILLPIDKKNKFDVSYFNEMIKDINQAHVAAEEVLSDHLYFYDRERDELMIPTK